MIILLHILAVILKPIHLFFTGHLSEIWYCFAINRNIIILLICLANFLLLRELNSRFMQFSKFIDNKAKEVYKLFLYNLLIIVKLSKCAFWFWLTSCVFSNIDFIISYFGIQIHIVFLIAELTPYLVIFTNVGILIYKLIRGDYKECVQLKNI